MDKKICRVPFSEIEIAVNGDVHVCCAVKMSQVIGNVYETPNFDDIWYGKKAKELRRDILNKKYSFCNLKICNPVDNIENDKLNLIDEDIVINENPPYPVYVKFCHETHCNIKCITCRDDFHISDKNTIDRLNSHIKTTYLPILKNCKIVSMNGNGEVFASKHCKALIKEIVKAYPDIKFDLHTNGTLCNKKICDELGISEKLISVNVSIHATKKETYEKIMIGANFENVINNIKWLSKLKEKGSINRLDLYFVVQKINYKEMEKMVEFASSVNADIYFWEYRNWGNEWGNKNYKNVAVFEKTHPEYNKFAKILQKNIFNNKNCHLNNFLANIKPINPFEHLLFVLKDVIMQYISLENEYEKGIKRKIIHIFGIKIKLRV